MGLTFRHTKGSSLTHDELDNNFREFFYSGSISGSSIVLYRSQSLNNEFVITPQVPSGSEYNIQYKVGNGDYATFGGRETFKYDHRQDHLKLTGSLTVKGNSDFQGDTTMTGDLIVSGTVRANTYITSIVTSSISYNSGSNRFGDTIDDLHSFTGSVNITGSQTIKGDTKITGSLIASGSPVHFTTPWPAAGQMQELFQLAPFTAIITGSNNREYRYAALGSHRNEDAVVGYQHQAIRINLCSDETTNPDYGSELLVAPLRVGTFIKASGSAKIAGISVSDRKNGETLASLYADTLSLNNYTGSLVNIGNTAAKTKIFGTVDITGSLSVSESVDLSDNLSIPGFPDVSASLASLYSGVGLVTVSDDNTPTLGGDLDISGSSIIGTGSIDIIGDISGSAIYSTLDIIASGSISGSQIHSTGNITAQGDITAEGDIIAFSSSDRDLKDNIKPISNPIEKIKLIGGYEFDWNDKQDSYIGHDIGVIAQEIEQVLPELVRDRSNGYKAVKYDKIVALLIEAVKDQQKQIDELKSKL